MSTEAMPMEYPATRGANIANNQVQDNQPAERIAVIEERSTNNQRDIDRLLHTMEKGFNDLRTEMRDMRNDIWNMRSDMRSDFKWIIGIIITVGTVGFSVGASLLIAILQKL